MNRLGRSILPLFSVGLVAVLILFVAGGASTDKGGATTRVDIIATGLEAPWALAFTPGRDLFVTERPGRIRIVREGQLLKRLVVTIPVAAVGEAGLMIESAGVVWKPSGIAVRGDTLYAAALLGRRLVRIPLAPAPIHEASALLENAWGRIRDVVVGPDDALYVATSNRDARGTPNPDDDRILRVWP